MSGNSILEILNCSCNSPEGCQPAENAETHRHFWETPREEADEEHEKDRFRALRQSSKIHKGLGSMWIGLHFPFGGHDRVGQKTGSGSNIRKDQKWCSQGILLRIGQGKSKNHRRIKNEIAADVQKTAKIADSVPAGYGAI